MPSFGSFTIGQDKEVVFNGAPHNYVNTITGNPETGDKAGVIISNQYFGDGKISFDVVFSEIDDKSSCEVIFDYDPLTDNYLAAGISAVGLFEIRRVFDGKSNIFGKTEKVVGEHSFLQSDVKYHIDLSVKGTLVSLKVDGVEVIQLVLPTNTRRSQVGLFFMNRANITVTNFSVISQRFKAFMIMQFNERYNGIYDSVIKESCGPSGCDLEVVRADELYGPGMIISDVVRIINESKFVIAEISPVETGNFNANVYYEVGYAHALGKPIILIALKGTKLPFDISPFRVLFYEDTIAGKEKILEMLKTNIFSLLEQYGLK